MKHFESLLNNHINASMSNANIKRKDINDYSNWRYLYYRYLALQTCAAYYKNNPPKFEDEKEELNTLNFEILFTEYQIFLWYSENDSIERCSDARNFVTNICKYCVSNKMSKNTLDALRLYVLKFGIKLDIEAYNKPLKYTFIIS